MTLTGESHQNDLHPDKASVEDDDVFSRPPSEELVDFDVVAAFAADAATVFCALPLGDDDESVLLGTSQGLLLGSSVHSPGVRPVFARGVGPEGIFQLARLADRQELLLVVGRERRLVAAKEEDVLLQEGAEPRERFR